MFKWNLQGVAMKDVTELLMRIIAHETKHVESMRHSLKEDELTILRLENKARVLEIEIEERKQLIEEYRGYLTDISKSDAIRTKLMSTTKRNADTKSSATKLELVKSLEKQGA